MKSKNTTIRDVAKHAGVSIATVSRYINKSGYVDAHTAEKIKAAARELHFRPSRLARGLKTSRSHQIMLVVPDISNPFYSFMYKTVQTAAHRRGYSVILYNTNEAMAEETAAVEMSVNIQADGIIFCSIDVNSEVMKELTNVCLPVVVLNSQETPIFDTIRSEKGMGIYLAARHLTELGHTRIAYAGGPGSSVVNSSRRSGYQKAMLEAALDIKEDYIFEMGFSMDAGYKAGKYFASLSPRPTAVCAANDLIAMGVLQAFNEIGLKIPEEISLTGMDNIEFSTLVRPALTTVTNDPGDFGENAAELLFQRIEGIYSGAPRVYTVARRLIVRSSTARL